MSTETQAGAAVETFEALCRQVPLRPIRTDEQHDRAIAQINALIDRYPNLDEMDETYADVLDYMDVLGLIIEDHETMLYGEPTDDGPDGDGEGE